jgi:hypothetical protein
MIRLITYPADKEFKSFLEQMELEISKSEENRHETAEPVENSQKLRTAILCAQLGFPNKVLSYIKITRARFRINTEIFLLL